MIGIRSVALPALLLVVSAALAAEATRVGTDSPFLPDSAGAQGRAENAPLELRGVFSIAGDVRFNITDAATKKGTWVGLNQPGDLRVTSYEKFGDVDVVTVEQGGRTLRLELVRPKTGKAVLPAQPRPGAPATPPQAQGPVTPVVLNPTPADQAKALEDTIAEVRRRRLMRQQQAAGQQVSPPQGQPPPPPPGQP